jgi:hypothetical protein
MAKSYSRRLVELVLWLVPGLKSLSIRIISDRPLDLSATRRMKRLDSLYINSEISKPVNLERLTQLELLGAKTADISKLTGLTDLPKLKLVHANNPKASWLNSLPISVEHLLLRGGLKPNVNLERLKNLEALSLSGSSKLDISTLPSSGTIRVLDLVGFRQLLGLETLSTKFPGLETINVAEIFNSDYERLLSLDQSWTVNLWNGLRK